MKVGRILIVTKDMMLSEKRQINGCHLRWVQFVSSGVMAEELVDD